MCSVFKWDCFLYLSLFRVVQVPLSEFDFSWSKISDIQSQVRNLFNIVKCCFSVICSYKYKDRLNALISNCLSLFSWRSWLRRTTISTSRPKRPTSPTWGLTTPTRSNRSTASTPSTSPWWRCLSASKFLHMLIWVSFAVILHTVTAHTAVCLMC